MKYFTTLFLSFFLSEFCCAFIRNKLEDTSNPKYYSDGDILKKITQKERPQPGSDHSLKKPNPEYYNPSRENMKDIEKLISFNSDGASHFNNEDITYGGYLETIMSFIATQPIPSESGHSIFSDDKKFEVKKNNIKKRPQPIISGSDYSIFSNVKKNEVKRKKIKKNPQPIPTGSDYSIFSNIKKNEVKRKKIKKNPQPIPTGSDYSIFSNDKKDDVKENMKKSPEPQPSGSDYSLDKPEPKHYTPSPENEEDCKDMPKLISSNSNHASDYDMKDEVIHISTENNDLEAVTPPEPATEPATENDNDESGEDGQVI